MENALTMVPLVMIRVSDRNVRKNLAAGTEDGDVAELAASIERQGLLNPPLLRETGDGHFEVIAGQRRVLACRRLGWIDVPALVRQLDDGEALAASLSENVQRADMDPLDKARAIKALEAMLGSLGAVATRLGLSLPTVRRYASLLCLAPELQQRIGTGGGPAQVGFLFRLAARFPDPAVQTEVYEKVAGFTGRVAEEITRRSGGDPDAVDGLVSLAIEGYFDRRPCGTDLESCPFVPEWATPGRQGDRRERGALTGRDRGTALTLARRSFRLARRARSVRLP